MDPAAFPGTAGADPDLTDPSDVDEGGSVSHLDSRLIADPQVFYQTLVEQIPAVVYLAHPDDPADVRFVSPQIERLLGYSQEEWLEPGFCWKNLLHPDDRDMVEQSDAESIATGETFNIRYRLLRRDGRAVWLRDQGELMRDADGTPLYWLGFTFDISGLKAIEDALLDAEERYRTLVEQNPAVTFSIEANRADRPMYVSPQAERMFGYSLADWQTNRDLWLSLVHPDDLEAALVDIRRTQETGEPFRHEYRMLARDGRTVWVRSESRLMQDANGDRSFWHGVLLDVTDRKLVEDALREAEWRYRTLVEQIPVVTYIEPHGGNGRPTYISPQIEDLLGYSQQDWLEHPDTSINAMHPEEIPRWIAALEQTDRTGKPYDLEHRMIRADGRIIWVRSTARLVYDDEGRPQFWQGTIQDITESVLADKRLAESEQRYRSLFDHNPDPVYSFDLDGNLVSANAALSAMTGYSVDEMLGASFKKLIHEADVPRVNEHFVKAAAGTAQDYECRALRKDGSTVDIHVTNLPIVVGGEIVGVYGVAKDISQRKSLERQLKHMAFHDWLTGLPNRLLFMDRLERALTALPRRQGSIALLFIDLDSFKQVNDSYGHDVGDQALRMVARLIASCVRGGDTIARMGGDEFTVLLLDVEREEDVLEIADRILKLLGKPIVAHGRNVRFSASIGIVFSSSPADEPLELLRRGDTAMYQAKASGKARYRVFEAAGT